MFPAGDWLTLGRQAFAEIRRKTQPKEVVSIFCWVAYLYTYFEYLIPYVMGFKKNMGALLSPADLALVYASQLFSDNFLILLPFFIVIYFGSKTRPPDHWRKLAKQVFIVALGKFGQQATTAVITQIRQKTSLKGMGIFAAVALLIYVAPTVIGLTDNGFYLLYFSCFWLAQMAGEYFLIGLSLLLAVYLAFKIARK